MGHRFEKEFRKQISYSEINRSDNKRTPTHTSDTVGKISISGDAGKSPWRLKSDRCRFEVSNFIAKLDGKT